MERQANDVEVTALDAFDEPCAAPLDGVGACFIERFLGFDVLLKLARGGLAKPDGGVDSGGITDAFGFVVDRESCDDFVGVADKLLEGCEGVRFIFGFAEDLCAIGNDRIRSDDPSWAVVEGFEDGSGFGFGGAHGVGFGRFVRMGGGFFDNGGIHLKAKTHLFEKLDTTRRGGCQDQR